MSWTQVVVYPPPSPELPYLAALFHNERLISSRTAPTFEAAEHLMAIMSGEFAKRIRAKEFPEDA